MTYIDGFVIPVPTANKQRDAAMGGMDELMKTDDRFNPERNPMPFDGKRMIFGGFSPVVTLKK
jgi:uncharacterized protein YbaA (DUF1428 family)